MALCEKTALRLWAGVAAIEDHPAEVVKFAQAVEAEVRKDDESLIRQMLEALEKSNSEWEDLADSGDAGYWKAEDQTHYQRSEAAITAARARLEKAP